MLGHFHARFFVESGQQPRLVSRAEREQDGMVGRMAKGVGYVEYLWSNGSILRIRTMLSWGATLSMYL